MAKTKINKNQLANVFVESVNEQLPDANGDVLITNVATADNLTSPDNINDYGTFIFRTSAGTKSIASDKDSEDPTYLSEATLMSIQGEIKNPRKDANNIVDNYIPSSTPRFTVAIDAATFGALSFVNNNSGTYVLTFDGTYWVYDDEGTSVNVDLATAGITVTPAKTGIETVVNDYITVDYTYETSEPDPETGTESVSEYASGTYTTETKLVFSSTNEATFAQKVNEVIGDYTFNYNGNAWMLGDASVNLAEYGISYTGIAINGDIFEVTYNGAMEVATPTSFVTSSFNQFNPANVIANAKIDDSGNIVYESGSSVTFIKGVGGLNNRYGSRHGDYTVYDENGSLVKVGWRENNPSQLITTVGTLTNNNGVVSGFKISNYLKLSKLNFINNNIEYVIKYSYDTNETNYRAAFLGVSGSTIFQINPSTDGITLTVIFNGTTYYWYDCNFKDYTYFKVQKNGTDLILSLGNSADNFTNSHTISNIQWEDLDIENYIGQTQSTNTTSTLSIDMNSTYIKINGQTWFDGKVLTTPESVITSDTDLNIDVYTDTEVAPVDQIKWITFNNDGYICVSMTNTSKLCVHPEWSGYMDTTYQEYIAPVTWENNPLVTVNGIDGSTPKRRKPSIINIMPLSGILVDDTTYQIHDNLPTYLARVGLVYDEIRFEDHRYINRIGMYEYTEANLAIVQAKGVDYVYDSQAIYYVLENPLTYIINFVTESGQAVIEDGKVKLDTNQSGQYMVCDFGTEEFIGTEVAVLGNFLYGNNLVDKLRTDVLTKSEQSLSQEQKEQVWKNLGTLPLYNYPVTVPSNADLVITLDDVHTMYELRPTSNIDAVTINTDNLTLKDSAWVTFYLYVDLRDIDYDITWPTGTDKIVWGNTSPTMTAQCCYLFSFTKPKGSDVFVGNQCYSWMAN